MSTLWTPVLTCEHGGNRIPRQYADLFKDADEVLASHRGWDLGGLEIARALSRALGVPLISSTTSRLLVDLNRSLHHPRIFSAYTKALSPDERARIVQRWYARYRQKVETRIQEVLACGGRVVHISVHTFTPVLDGDVRRVDVGFLYDPSREAERVFCDGWHRGLRQLNPQLRIRRNQPYRGKADGFTTSLRRTCDAARYAGIELEANQRLREERRGWQALKRHLASSLCDALRDRVEDHQRR